MAVHGTSALDKRQTRRCFLGIVGVGGLGVALLSACGNGQATAGASRTASSPGVGTTALSTGATRTATAHSGGAATIAASASTTGGAQPAPTAPAVVKVGKGAKTLTFWHYYGLANSVPLAKVVGGYQAVRPDIALELDFTPNNKLLEKLQAAIAGNSMPDVAQTDLVWVPIMIGTQQTLALDQYFKQEKYDVSDFFTALLQYDQGDDGKYYAVPLDTDNAQLFYNKNMVQAAGLDFEKSPPQTWADLADVAQKLTDPSKQQWGLDLGPQVTQGNQGALTNRHMILTWQTGNQYFAPWNGRPERGAPAFNTDAGITAWQWNVDMVLKYKVAPPTSPQLGFTSGHEAMFYNGDWAIGNTLRQIGAGFEMGTMAFPGQTAGKAGVCWSGGEHVQAFRGKNQDDAAQFLLWLTSPANIESFNTQTGYIPPRQSVINGKSYQTWLTQNPLYKVYATSMAKTQPRVPTNVFTQLTNAISLELEKPIKQTLTVKDALAAAVQDCLAIMKQAGYQP
ncbi:MAG TPA: ABC transporter substrate-binding protein [Chloroflexota bacterium]|nr:ABC transporter substrate-binding protein [Chloroflexota bacterium]